MWTDTDREKYKDGGLRYESDMTDAEWTIIEPFVAHHVTYTANLREVINAHFTMLRTGCQWRYIPREFGAWQTMRTWHDRFRREGLWDRINASLVRSVRQQEGRATEPATGLIDSQSVVSGPQKGERGFDGNKKTKGIKRHVMTWSLGLILAVIVTPANAHDTSAVDALLQRGRDSGWSIVRAKVDGIYHGRAIDAASRAHGVDFEMTIKPANRIGQAFVPLPLRWRIEATFGTLANRCRRLTRNLEASPNTAETMTMVAAVRRTVRRYAGNLMQ